MIELGTVMESPPPDEKCGLQRCAASGRQSQRGLRPTLLPSECHEERNYRAVHRTWLLARPWRLVSAQRPHHAARHLAAQPREPPHH